MTNCLREAQCRRCQQRQTVEPSGNYVVIVTSWVRVRITSSSVELRRPKRWDCGDTGRRSGCHPVIWCHPDLAFDYRLNTLRRWYIAIVMSWHGGSKAHPALEVYSKALNQHIHHPRIRKTTLPQARNYFVMLLRERSDRDSQNICDNLTRQRMTSYRRPASEIRIMNNSENGTNARIQSRRLNT